jgi:hypothetical protein
MEYITANGTEYECPTVSTSTNGISFTINGDVSEIAASFKQVTELTVSGDDKEVYGVYDNLYFSSATVDSDGIVTVFMVIKSSTEQRIEQLETTQEEQDELIAEIMFGEV